MLLKGLNVRGDFLTTLISYEKQLCIYSNLKFKYFDFSLLNAERIINEKLGKI